MVRAPSIRREARGIAGLPAALLRPKSASSLERIPALFCLHLNASVAVYQGGSISYDLAQRFFPGVADGKEAETQ